MPTDVDESTFFSKINKVIDLSLFAIGSVQIKQKDRVKLVRAVKVKLDWPTDVFADLVAELTNA